MQTASPPKRSRREDTPPPVISVRPATDHPNVPILNKGAQEQEKDGLPYWQQGGPAFGDGAAAPEDEDAVLRQRGREQQEDGPRCEQPGRRWNGDVAAAPRNGKIALRQRARGPLPDVRPHAQQGRPRNIAAAPKHNKLALRRREWAQQQGGSPYEQQGRSPNGDLVAAPTHGNMVPRQPLQAVPLVPSPDKPMGASIAHYVTMASARDVENAPTAPPTGPGQMIPFPISGSTVPAATAPQTATGVEQLSENGDGQQERSPNGDNAAAPIDEPTFGTRLEDMSQEEFQEFFRQELADWDLNRADGAAQLPAPVSGLAENDAPANIDADIAEQWTPEAIAAEFAMRGQLDAANPEMLASTGGGMVGDAADDWMPFDEGTMSVNGGTYAAE